jgi:superfamily II DNA or RNA helicase
MAKPTLSSSAFYQMIGRGLRTYPNKENCILVDIVDNSSKNQIITVPTLFGLKSTFDFGGAEVGIIVNELKNRIIEAPNSFNAISIQDARFVHLHKKSIFLKKFINS